MFYTAIVRSPEKIISDLSYRFQTNATDRSSCSRTRDMWASPTKRTRWQRWCAVCYTTTPESGPAHRKVHRAPNGSTTVPVKHPGKVENSRKRCHTLWWHENRRWEARIAIWLTCVLKDRRIGPSRCHRRSNWKTTSRASTRRGLNPCGAARWEFGFIWLPTPQLKGWSSRVVSSWRWARLRWCSLQGRSVGFCSHRWQLQLWPSLVDL